VLLSPRGRGRHQDPKNPKYLSTGDAFKKVYREGGIRSLNRGFFGTFLRDGYVLVPRWLLPWRCGRKACTAVLVLLSVGSAFYFSTYEYLKLKFTPAGKVGALAGGHRVPHANGRHECLAAATAAAATLAYRLNGIFLPLSPSAVLFPVRLVAFVARMAPVLAGP
jgi:hypothetical protein